MVALDSPVRTKFEREITLPALRTNGGCPRRKFDEQQQLLETDMPKWSKEANFQLKIPEKCTRCVGGTHRVDSVHLFIAGMFCTSHFARSIAFAITDASCACDETFSVWRLEPFVWAGDAPVSACVRYSQHRLLFHICSVAWNPGSSKGTGASSGMVGTLPRIGWIFKS